MLVKGSCAAEGVTDGRTGILIEESGEALAATLLALDIGKMHEIGRHAMDEIYLSWADSVAMAAERYHIVLENHRSGRLQPKTGPLRGFYTIGDEMRSELAAARDTAGAVRSAVRDTVRTSFRDAAEELQRELNRAQSILERYL